ncbi:MAG: 6-carboxytetrahydropterin synthase [Bacteroidales bacterium]|jgi:6-pyruvoyltetrahydropterin/6-carboxytetrahydropterin synthase|nr:6-carboxytetrahydropterin synthase [Bacteroidales bacterium]MCK9497950.1 6-carboxytetrahydropterin synthase [Bacteroidales bacterium]MDY0315178.1 6-carboxytetrahydropterin synthase [Bacteroidales bacterium]
MTKIRLTKLFEFEAAHALHNYDGLCRNIHGHSYKLAVTIIGEPNSDPDSPKLGMLMDFGVLKNIIKENIIDKFDHSVLLSHWEDVYFFKSDNPIFERLHMFDFQPTAENMLIHFAEIIQNLLPENIKLFSLKLNETASSFAEWYAEDQI